MGDTAVADSAVRDAGATSGARRSSPPSSPPHSPKEPAARRNLFPTQEPIGMLPDLQDEARRLLSGAPQPEVERVGSPPPVMMRSSSPPPSGPPSEDPLPPGSFSRQGTSFSRQGTGVSFMVQVSSGSGDVTEPCRTGGPQFGGHEAV